MWERRARRQDVFWIAAGLALALGCGESSEPVDTVTATAREGAQPVRPRVRATAPVQRDTRPLEIRRKEIEEIPFVETDEAKALAKLKPQLADPEIEVREAVVLALGAIETEEATDLLAAQIRVEEDPMLKIDIMDQLIDREAPQTLDALLYMLADTDSDVREAAADGLDDLGDERAVPGLHDALRAEADEFVRDAILFALSSLDPEFDEDEYEEEDE